MRVNLFQIKQMNKLFIVLIWLVLSSKLAFWINVIPSSTYENNCEWANVYENIYITWSNIDIFPTDLMTSDKLLFVRNGESSVTIWQNTNWILSNGCFQTLNGATWWWRLSNVVPWNSQPVWVFKNFWNICQWNRVLRSNTWLPSVQFVYRVAYREETWFSSWNDNYFYYPFVGNRLANTPTSLSNQTTRVWGDIKVHANECHNFTFSWCWDWERNWTEVCDPNAPWESNCTSTCTRPTLWWSSWSSPACYLTPSYWSISPTINVSTWSTLCSSWNLINFWPIRKNDNSIVDWTTINLWTWYLNKSINVDTQIIWRSWNIDLWNWINFNILSNTWVMANICMNSLPTTNDDIRLIFHTKWDDYWWACDTEDSSSSSSWGSNYCWDWILQRPNSSWIMEECDFWNWTWPAWCQKTTCEILENTTPWGLTDSNNSTPSGWAIVLSPWNSLLLGWWMWVFEYLTSNNAYIQNNSTSDIYIDKKLCVYKNGFEYNAMNWTNICSNWEVWFLSKNGWKKNLYVADDKFVANISSMPSTKTYVDGEIITTLEWLQSTNSFLKSILKVRVAKPTVNTIGWWASLLNWIRFSDVNILSQWWGLLNPELNRNLILTSLWINPLSSYTKTITDTEFISKSKTDGNNDLSWFNEKFWSWNTSVINTLPNQKFNWLENVFVQVWNVNLSSQTINWWNKTFIVEDWNLNINGNITSSDNILFVVKNGDIIIKNNVTKIDAIIINIWWEIKAEDDSTNNRLVVNWAIYWKVDDLLGKRTYIKDRGEYVDVWTNVNFTSKVFTSPPPLLSKFLGEYMEWNKIPK